MTGTTNTERSPGAAPSRWRHGGGRWARGRHYQAAFADRTSTTTEAATSATTASTNSSQCVLMSSITEGPYYLDGASGEGRPGVSQGVGEFVL
jgi:hypothetical protein